MGLKLEESQPAHQFLQEQQHLVQMAQNSYSLHSHFQPLAKALLDFQFQ
jgi:hypothetical protein